MHEEAAETLIQEHDLANVYGLSLAAFKSDIKTVLELVYQKGRDSVESRCAVCKGPGACCRRCH